MGILRILEKAEDARPDNYDEDDDDDEGRTKRTHAAYFSDNPITRFSRSESFNSTWILSWTKSACDRIFLRQCTHF